MLPMVFFLTNCGKDGKEPGLTDQKGLSQMVETRAACPPSDNYLCGLEITLNGTSTLYGCPIPWSIKYRVCPWGIQCTEPTWNLNVLWTNSPQCDNLLSAWYSSVDFNDPTRRRLYDFYHTLSKQIVADARLEMVKAVKISDPGKFACTTFDPCNSAGAQIRMTAQECRKLCVNSSPIFPTIIVICGTACCQGVTPFCIDQDGNNHCIQTPTITQISGCDTNQVGLECLEGSGICGSDPCQRI